MHKVVRCEASRGRERGRSEKQTLNLLKLRNLRDRDNELAADDTEGKGGEEGQQRKRTF